MKKTLARGLTALAGAALMLGTAACGSSADIAGPPGDVSDPKNPVYFKYADNPSFDLVYLADKLGYFDDAGIKPKYVGPVDGNQLIPLTDTGDLDFATRMASLTISAINGGADLKIVAASNQTLPDAPHMNYFVRKDSGITATSLDELEGKTIAMNGFGACAEYVTKQYLTSKGVDVDKVNWVPTPDAQSEQAVETGAADLSIIHAPFSGHALNNPDLVSLFSDFDLDGGASGSQPYTGNGKFIRRFPAQTEELVGILGKTQSWVNRNPDQARQYIADRIGQNVQDITRYAYVNNAIIDRKQIQYWIDTLEKFGQVPEDSLTADDVATNQYNPYAESDALLETQAENQVDLTVGEK
ncbi:ABC transporter substrate-binding protein [Nocardia jinanensis]|uniref:Sulfonate ABC transporter substrate-binding protein n=1 Tax=Nocardia jinanensis TaxID=382504 RepID=A0A917VP23_9NOCA|nr:ABC transporter substrate-binding protein [Nocardia jinanensis]GGL03321.1 sulfonate ABC transporter substrate-binding protein [Nocardia jinanensis]